MELEASNGRRALATIVFGHAFRYFRDCCIKELNEVSIVQSGFSVEDIQWVITVPAIWRQSAKQFMRHAAIQVAIPLITLYYGSRLSKQGHFGKLSCFVLFFGR